MDPPIRPRHLGFIMATLQTATNKRDKYACHLYMSFSLHGAHIIGCKGRATTLSRQTLGESTLNYKEMLWFYSGFFCTPSRLER